MSHRELHPTLVLIPRDRADLVLGTCGSGDMAAPTVSDPSSVRGYSDAAMGVSRNCLETSFFPGDLHPKSKPWGLDSKMQTGHSCPSASPIPRDGQHSSVPGPVPGGIPLAGEAETSGWWQDGGSSSSESNSTFSSFTHLPEGFWIQPELLSRR